MLNREETCECGTYFISATLRHTCVLCDLCDPSSSSCCYYYVCPVMHNVKSNISLARCVAKRLSRLTSFADANHIMPVCTNEIIAMHASASKAHNTIRHYLLNAGSFASTKASLIIHILHKRTQKHIHYMYLHIMENSNQHWHRSSFQAFVRDREKLKKQIKSQSNNFMLVFVGDLFACNTGL